MSSNWSTQFASGCLKVDFKPLNVAFKSPPRYRARAESSVQVLYKATFSLEVTPWITMLRSGGVDCPLSPTLACDVHGTSPHQQPPRAHRPISAVVQTLEDPVARGIEAFLSSDPVMPARPRSEIQARASVVKAHSDCSPFVAIQFYGRAVRLCVA